MSDADRDHMACAICLEEKPCAQPLPCCGREGSSLTCCATCIRTLCGHDGSLGRCPVCRAMLAFVDGAVIRAQHARGRCSSCWAENVALVEANGGSKLASGFTRCTVCTLHSGAWIRRLRGRAAATLRRLVRLPLRLVSTALAAALSSAVEVVSSALNCREAGFRSDNFSGYG